MPPTAGAAPSASAASSASASAPVLPRLAALAALTSLLLLLAQLAGQLRVAPPPAPPGRRGINDKPPSRSRPAAAALPPFQPTPRKPLCADTCPSARDGTCDEGRPPFAPLHGGDNNNNPYYVVSCDLGTDCADCGPWAGGAANTSAWQGQGEDKGDQQVGPIAFLRREGYEVRARRAVVPGAGGAPLALWFAYADPDKDVDVSRSAHETGIVEPGLTALAVRALEGPCGARARWRRWRRRERRRHMRRHDEEEREAGGGGAPSSSASDDDDDSRLRLIVGGPAGPLHARDEEGGLGPAGQQSTALLSFADAPESGATYPASLSSSSFSFAEDGDGDDNDDNDDGSGLLLDVGANFGWYTLVAASLGCRAVAWEPVPRFRAFLEWAVARNRLLEVVQVRGAAVTDGGGGDADQSPPETVEIVVGNRGIWGLAGIGGANLDPSVRNEGAYERTRVKSERLDGVARELVARGLLRPDAAAAARGAVGPAVPLPEARVPIVPSSYFYPRIDLLKVDVEGFEPAVMRSAVGGGGGGGGRRQQARRRRSESSPPPPPPPLLAHVRSAALEYSPGVHERAQAWERARDPPRMLLRLMRLMGGGDGGGGRVRIAHLPDAFVRAPPSAFPPLKAAAADDDDELANDDSAMVAPLPNVTAIPTAAAATGGVLREVTRAALAQDLADAARLSGAGWGAAPEPLPVCESMRSAGLPVRGVPEGLHPHGFRSTFGHNTNVFASVRMHEIVRPGEWAAAEAAEADGGGGGAPAAAAAPASTLPWRPPPAPLAWFVPDDPGATGMGGRPCSNLVRDVFWPALSLSLPPAAERARILLAHRCRCPRSSAPAFASNGTTRDAAAAAEDDLLGACRAVEEAADACARGGSTGFAAMTEEEVQEALAHDERREAAEEEEEADV